LQGLFYKSDLVLLLFGDFVIEVDPSSRSTQLKYIYSAEDLFEYSPNTFIKKISNNSDNLEGVTLIQQQAKLFYIF